MYHINNYTNSLNIWTQHLCSKILMMSDTKMPYTHCDLGICKPLKFCTFFSGLCIMHIYTLTFILQITIAITTPSHINVINCVVMSLGYIAFFNHFLFVHIFRFSSFMHPVRRYKLHPRYAFKNVSGWFNKTTSYIHFRSSVFYEPNNCDPAQGRDSSQCEMSEYLARTY